MADPTLNVVVNANASQAESALKGLENKGTSASNLIAGGFLKAQLAIGAITGIAKGVENGIKSVIDASNAQVLAEQQLIASLQENGQASQSNIDMLSARASQMQQDLLIGDETSLQLMAQAESLTKLSAEKLPDVIKASSAFAEMMGTDVDSAMTLVTKTIASGKNALARYGLEIDTTGSKEDILNQILDKTHGGLAMIEARADTVGGASTRLKNTWGDLQEEVGKLFTDNKYLADVLNLVNDIVVKIMGQVQEWMKQNPQLAEQLKGDLANGVLTAVQVIDVLATGLIQLGYAFAWSTEAEKVAYYWLTRNSEAMERAQTAMGNYQQMMQLVGSSFSERQNLYSDMRIQIAQQQEANLNFIGPRQSSSVLNVRVVGGDPLSVADALVG